MPRYQLRSQALISLCLVGIVSQLTRFAKEVYLVQENFQGDASLGDKCLLFNHE